MDSQKIIKKRSFSEAQKHWRGWDDNACLGVRNTSSIWAWHNSLDQRPPWYCIVSPLLQNKKKLEIEKHTYWILLSCNLSVIYSTFHGMDLRNMGNMTRGITWFYEFQQSATFLHFFGKKDDDISFFVIYVQHFTCWAPTLHTM